MSETGYYLEGRHEGGVATPGTSSPPRLPLLLHPSRMAPSPLLRAEPIPTQPRLIPSPCLTSASREAVRIPGTSTPEPQYLNVSHDSRPGSNDPSPEASFGSPTIRPRFRILDDAQTTIKARSVRSPGSCGNGSSLNTIRPDTRLRMTPIRGMNEDQALHHDDGVMDRGPHLDLDLDLDLDLRRAGDTVGGAGFFHREEQDGDEHEQDRDHTADQHPSLPTLPPTGTLLLKAFHQVRDRHKTLIPNIIGDPYCHSHSNSYSRGKIPHWEQGFQLSRSYQRILDGLPKSSDEGSSNSVVQYGRGRGYGDGDRATLPAPYVLAASLHEVKGGGGGGMMSASASAPLDEEAPYADGQERENGPIEDFLTLAGKVDEVDIENCFHCDRARDRVRGECVLVEVEGRGRQWVCRGGGCVMAN